ncbi:MAG: hypothetical protein K2H96_03265 [Muribaculaceae bacterium]|nr:hypothetical protein [Muribaculaceae bacterium]
MSEKFDIDHNRLFGLLQEVLSQDLTQLKLDANGGNSILFVYPNDEDSLYVAEAKRRFRKNAIFVDVAQTLTNFQEKMGIEKFKRIEKRMGNAVYFRKDPDGKPVEDTFFKFLTDRLALAAQQGYPVFLVGTSALANKGFSNIDIMELENVKSAPQPLVYFYPATIEGAKIYFLGDHNHVASKYRCRVII